MKSMVSKSEAILKSLAFTVGVAAVLVCFWDVNVFDAFLDAAILGLVFSIVLVVFGIAVDLFMR